MRLGDQLGRLAYRPFQATSNVCMLGLPERRGERRLRHQKHLQNRETKEEVNLPFNNLLSVSFEITKPLNVDYVHILFSNCTA